MQNVERMLWYVLSAPLLFLLSACGSGELAVGNTAPAFTLPNAAGGDVSLSDYQGQPMLLYFHMAGG